MRHVRLFSIPAVLTAACMMLLSSPGYADENARFTAFLNKLGVSQDQMTAITAVRSQAAPQIDAAKQALKTSRGALRQQIESSGATDDQLMALYAQVSTNAQALHKLRFESLLKVRAILSPAQRQQAAQILQEKRHQRHGDMEEDDEPSVP